MAKQAVFVAPTHAFGSPIISKYQLVSGAVYHLTTKSRLSNPLQSSCKTEGKFVI